MRNVANLALTFWLAAALALGPQIPATGITLPRPAVLPVAQEQHDHDHDHEHEEEPDHGETLTTDTDPWKNTAAPLLMIAAGVLYLGFVRWQSNRRRGVVSRPR